MSCLVCLACSGKAPDSKTPTNANADGNGIERVADKDGNGVERVAEKEGNGIERVADKDGNGVERVADRKGEETLAASNK